MAVFLTLLTTRGSCIQVNDGLVLVKITVNTLLLMQSLRSRPSQGPRKPQRAPSKLARPGAGRTPRDGSKNKIDDKIKKRISTRYADISSPTPLTGLPPVPPIPPNMDIVSAGQNSKDYAALEADEDVRDRTVIRDDAKVASDDRKLLSAEDFDPTACK